MIERLKLIKFILATVVLVPIVYILIPFILISVNSKIGLPVLSFSGQNIIGTGIVLTGLLIFPLCSSIFFKFGERTPLFTEQSGKFFKVGPYQYTRNPMYIGHVLVLLGIFIWQGSFLLFLFSLTVLYILHLYLIFFEEPQLRKRYGKKYEIYFRSVPRWIGYKIGK